MPADDRKDGPAPRGSGQATTVPSGTRIVGGTYEVERLLKAGGMGEVYRGRNVFNGLPVAIKIVLGSQSSDETHTKLFEREALVLSKLAHEAIVRYHVYTVDPIIGRPCLVMEFVPGPSLVERMAEGPMPMDDVRTVMRRVASGLGAAHKLGVIHRDLSPDNVILEDGLVEHAKLIDFGIAKAGTVSAGTMLEGRVAGKYNYMAPEQLGLADGVVDARADIYALGLVVIGMFRGSALNMGENPFEAITRRQAVPDLSSVPPEMKPILARMLAPLPQDRPDSMLMLIKMLDQPGYMPPPPPPKSALLDSTVLGGPVPVQPPQEVYKSYVDPTSPPSVLPVQDSTVVSQMVSAVRNKPASVVEEDVSDRTVVRPKGPTTPGNAALDATVITGVANGMSAAADRFEASRSGARGTANPGAAYSGSAADVPEGFGKATAAIQANSRSSSAPAATSPKGKGLPLALGGVVLAAAIGGGAFFMAQGGKPPAPEPATTSTATATAPIAPVSTPTVAATATPLPQDTAAPTPAPPDFSTQVAWLTDAAKGKCIHFEPGPGAAGSNLHWTALTAAPAGVAALSSKFTDTFQTSPTIDVVSVGKDQCAALEFATFRGTQSASNLGISLDQKDGVLKGGAALRGTVSGSAGRSTAIFLISSTGAVARLDGYLTSDAKSDARFEVPVTVAPGSKASDQLLMSITTSDPVPDFATLTDGYTAETVMPRLALWLQESNQTAEIDLKPFRLEP